MELPYDLAIQFKALPKIPLLLLFNDADDEFPEDSINYLVQKKLDKMAELLAPKKNDEE